MLVPVPDGSAYGCAESEESAEYLDGGGLRPASAACGGVAGHAGGAGVAEIGLLRAATGIRIGQAHSRAPTVLDFRVAFVANENCLSSHEILLVSP
jgi:hypothetical protein